MLTGFLICGHLWTDRPAQWPVPWQRWTRRAEILIPAGSETSQFSASRIFAAAYPEAVGIACLIASPTWRRFAAGDLAHQQQFIAHIGQQLGRPGYQPADLGDAITHWMKYDSWRPPSRPHTTYPQTRGYGHGLAQAGTSTHSLHRHERSALWFSLYRRGGRVILHHGHIRPVLIRDWSPRMDGITATIWASQTTMHPDGRPPAPSRSPENPDLRETQRGGGLQGQSRP